MTTGDEQSSGSAYGPGLQEFAARYESLQPEALHARLLPFLPSPPGLVLDIGAGTGRDAAWLARKGFEVWAVEPEEGFRRIGQTLHPSANVHWLDDRLPELAKVHKLGLSFDLIWASAVWMHVPPADRGRAFRRIATLLRPGARFVVSLRLGPPDPDRVMFPVSAEEVERLAIGHGLRTLARIDDEDRLGRQDLRWSNLVLQLPDDGSEALPLLRSIILEDVKAATYKLALLRVLAKAADTAGSLARHDGEAFVRLPLGLLALFWLRMFKPLIELGYPQSPRHGSGAGLGFVKEPFHALRPVAPTELRIGARFSAELGSTVVRALGDCARTIAEMPAHYITWPDGRPMFPTTYAGRPRLRGSVVLDPELLWTFGYSDVPVELWWALRRLAAWIEPMLVAEWVRLTRAYAERQGRSLSGDAIAQSLRWIDPKRDTGIVRALVGRMFEKGTPVYCIWSGKKIHDPSRIEIDHCFPWTVWPCDDLWNLLPTAVEVNQAKRDRLPSREALRSARERIASFWETAWIRSEAFAERFFLEARASLPFEPAEGTASRLDDLFTAVEVQRLRLRRDQLVPEWSGPPS